MFGGDNVAPNPQQLAPGHTATESGPTSPCVQDILARQRIDILM